MVKHTNFKCSHFGFFESNVYISEKTHSWTKLHNLIPPTCIIKNKFPQTKYLRSEGGLLIVHAGCAPTFRQSHCWACFILFWRKRKSSDFHNRIQGDIGDILQAKMRWLLSFRWCSYKTIFTEYDLKKNPHKNLNCTQFYIS